MGNRFQRTLSSPDPISERLPLVPWLYRVIGIPKIRIQVRFRGNALYILCESSSCPSRSIVLDRLFAALEKTNLDDLLPENQASVYQIIVYGRVAGEKHPHWAEVIPVAQIDQYLDEVETDHAPPHPSTIALTNLRLAKEGKPEAIARYLSEELTSLGISVQASVRSLALSEEPGLPQTANLASVFTSAASLTPQALLNRLWVVCESAYSPEVGLMAELIPPKLRDLELQGFRDALVLSRVQGETEPEWILRVDLTPPNEMLKDWARWGDVEALIRLLQRSLRDQAIEISATLMETTLHLTCHHLDVPEKEVVLATLVPLLETVAPQGIHAAVVYGLEDTEEPTPYLSIPETPVWVQWVNLPAAEHPALADSTDQLAKQGDLAAIAFLLTRLLNPDLDIQLATGGIQIQVRQKEDLLHIMTDAPICPSQNQVGVLVANMVKALELPSVQGVRVYGRRAGQKRPLWSYGVDFTVRDRLVPEATPEFAASDAYVGDLLTTMPGELAARSQDPGEVETLWERWLEGVQTGIARSRLFAVEAPTGGLSTAARPVQTAGAHDKKVALICGVLGILLTVQADLGLGQILRSTEKSTPKPSASPSPTDNLPLSQLSLQKSGAAKSDSIFNSLGFTQSGQTVISPTTSSKDGASKSLVASPLKPKAAVDTARSPYPTFNTTQLDEKLVLYRQFVAQSGAPDVLIVGSSRAMRGIDPAVLEQALATQGYPGLKVFNFGVNGATAQVVDLIVRRILPSEKMPKLIIFADGLRALNSGRTDVTYGAIASSPGFHKLPDASTASASESPESPLALTKPIETIARTNTIVSDSYKSFNTQLLEQLSILSVIYNQRTQLQNALVKSLTSGWRMETLSDSGDEEGIPQDGQGLIDIQGFLPISNRFNPVTYYQKYSRISGENDGDYADFSLDGLQTEALRNMAKFTRSQNIPLVVLNLPLTEQYLDPFRREREKQFQEYLLRMSTELGFTYRDILDNWLSTPDFFSDPSHLNRYGSYAVSQHIAKDALIPWKKR
jgi:hypothetical protein